jgi:ribonuclease-3
MELTEDDLSQAESILGYSFRDRSLLREALTHSSAAADRLSSNERMEFLGDAVLDLVVCERIYADFPEHEEVPLTKLKSAVVSRRTCAAVAREAGIADLLLVGRGVIGRQEMPASLAAGVYESVVAAVFLDGGMEAARTFILRAMLPHIELLADAVHGHNFKAMLQQHAQDRLDATPAYDLLDEKGPDHRKCFEVCVNLDGRRFQGGWGPNKKAAEQKAALVALRELDVVDEAGFDRAVAALDVLAPTTI